MFCPGCFVHTHLLVLTCEQITRSPHTALRTKEKTGAQQPGFAAMYLILACLFQLIVSRLHRNSQCRAEKIGETISVVNQIARCFHSLSRMHSTTQIPLLGSWHEDHLAFRITLTRTDI